MDGKKFKKLIKKVDDAYDYLKGYRLEELKEDDRYYIGALMEYIKYLEKATTNAQNAAIEEIAKNTNWREIL